MHILTYLFVSWGEFAARASGMRVRLLFKHFLPFLMSKKAQTRHLRHSQPNCHGKASVLALETVIHLCIHSQNEVTLLTAECAFMFQSKCSMAPKLCVDRCSEIEFYNNKVADCKHQVTAVPEDFSVYYSIPFNHSRRAGGGGLCRLMVLLLSSSQWWWGL